jgi:uncharacterized membrane protein YjjP (DUF1212 family)
MTKPSTKWITTQIVALAALAVSVANAGEWQQAHTIALIGIVAQALVSYLVPNSTGDLQRMRVRREKAQPTP